MGYYILGKQDSYMACNTRVGLGIRLHFKDNSIQNDKTHYRPDSLGILEQDNTHMSKGIFI